MEERIASGPIKEGKNSLEFEVKSINNFPGVRRTGPFPMGGRPDRIGKGTNNGKKLPSKGGYGYLT